ncbi:MAG: N-6 DNA methylase [Desulfobacterales bacterium]
MLIIECKTFGTEHDKEKQKTLEEGGQLFGYLANDHSATHLCIYSSRLYKGCIEYRSDIIHVEDSPEAKEKFSKEKADGHTAARQALPLFEHAHNRETLHHAWKTTYGGTFLTSGIFEEEFTPYAIGYTPWRGKALRDFNGQNGSTRVFNSFMEILRHNNVSDRENAFNRLCAIILAKLIDEEREPAAILDFQWFPNKDTAEDLIDRLQRLYKRGMKETLGEEITYFEERDIDQAFIAHRRDMARNEVKKIFRALKFYTNSDFAFKEVHNKKLFEQNTQVVREIVELFQGYRLKYTSKQAFLGNLFELLLNSGFKQSEGQFFTPIPIARFIMRCLPLRERMAAAIETGSPRIIPHVMDYACGSAHFLTEIIEEIQEDLRALKRPEAENTTWARDHVWGIEKDCRLARTAKIALFLHGAGDANILHDDGLDHANPILPKPGTVDVLVANPPYSVKDFKQHLRLQSNRFTLLPHLTANSSEIETLFVERTAQLLAVGGMAGIILPSSILSNSGIYQRTRALLLEKFLLRGIVELGGSAFIATGTNTIILLIERRPDTHRDHFSIRADALFDEEKKPNDADYADSDLLRAYCTAAGLDFADYCQWLADLHGELPEGLEQTTLFSAYHSEFDGLADTKRRRAQVTFRKLPQDEQQSELRGKFLRHCREAERGKFFYFALAHVETLEKGEIIPQRTTILRGAGSKAEEQAFLGYKWSQRRGAEGMVNLREPYDGGLLCTPDTDSRMEPPGKAAHHFRHAFLDKEADELPDDSPLNGKLLTAPTSACFDFSRTACDLAVNLSPAEESATPIFDTQYPLVTFDQIATLEYGKPLPERSRIAGDYPVMGSNGIVGSHNEYLIQGPAIIVGRKGSAGRVTYIEKNCYPIDTTFFIAHNPQKTNLRYIQAMLQELKLEDQAKALGVPGLNRNDVYKISVPLPPLEVQQKIVQAIEALEKKAEIYVINDLEEQKRQILLDGIK